MFMLMHAILLLQNIPKGHSRSQSNPQIEIDLDPSDVVRVPPDEALLCPAHAFARFHAGGTNDGRVPRQAQGVPGALPPPRAPALLTAPWLQATGTRAAQLEHSGAFDLAFESYLKAAQAALFLIRHTAEPVPKARLREVSKGWLERAERIKHAKQGAIGPVRRQRLSVGA